MAAVDDSLKIDRGVTTLKERALEKMRDAILDFRFAPGERLVERALCARLDVSRSVVREVLRHLESEGLVESVPHRGPVVAEVDRDTAAQIYELRAHLEAIGARACAETASDRDLARLNRRLRALERAFEAGDKRAILTATTGFYDVMFTSGGKAVAWSILQSLNARINALRGMTVLSAGRAGDSLNEMRNIMAAIDSRDPARAEAACVAHVETAAAVAMFIFKTREAGA